MMNETTYSTMGILATAAENLTNVTSVWERHPGNRMYEVHKPEMIAVDKFVTPVWYIVGALGNFLAFAVWIQRPMRHSSGCYLAALALNDMLFILLHTVYEMQMTWEIRVVQLPGLCEIFSIVFLAPQYMSPLLVLGFTVERYISICHPFQREKFCTISRAVKVVALLAGISFALASIQGYFFMFDKVRNECDIRPEISAGGTRSIWSIWTWITELLVFAIVPLAVLLTNVLVIREARKLSAQEGQHESRRHKRATTIMLLAVSFYLIFTTLPVTIVYAIYFSYQPGDAYLTDEQIRADATWQQYLTYVFARQVVQEIGMSHFAANFYIYCITGKIFRRELKKIFLRCLCKTDRVSGFDYDTNYSLKNRNTLTSVVNGNGTTSATTNLLLANHNV